MLHVSKYAALVAALLISPTVSAQTTFSPVGTHPFSGTLSVQKNLPFASSCTVSLDFIIASGGTATIDNAVVSGAGLGCGVINFTGAPYPVFHGGAGNNTPLYVANFRVDIDQINQQYGADACEGVMEIELDEVGGVSVLNFSTPISDVTDADPDTNAGNTEYPCSIVGTLTDQDPDVITAMP